MEQSPTIKSISSALCKAQAEYKPIKRNAVNPFFKSRYADLAQVCETLMPLLVKHGISVTQPTDDYDGVTYVQTQFMHGESGEWIRGKYPVKPIKQDPQAQGSATTYARRYALCAMAGIAVEGDDDDGAAGSGTHRQSVVQAPTQQPTQPKKAAAKQSPPAKQVPQEDKEPEFNPDAQATEQQLDFMQAVLTKAGVGAAKVLERFGKEKLNDLTLGECRKVVEGCTTKIAQAEAYAQAQQAQAEAQAQQS
jgi:hypothetical protein